MNTFFSQPRFKFTKRTYTASEVASKQGSLPVLPPKSNLLADKHHAILTKAAGEGKPVLTMGGTDDADGETSGGGVCFRVGVFEYVGNGECWILGVFSVLSVFGGVGVLTLGRTGRDCPYTTVPNQGHRIFRAQQVHDKKHYAHGYREQREKMEYVDDLRPIIAYADTGAHPPSTSKTNYTVAKRYCGHLSSSPPPPTPPASDLLESTMLIIARTDAESGKLISSTVDVADHELIKGTTGRGNPVEAAIKESTIKDKEGAVKTFKDATISDMREVAKDILGAPVFWDHEKGYYHVNGGLGPAIKRATTFAPYADLVWLETETPDIEEARYFARKIRETYPET
ncbi:mitochondrial 2-methylisocitrate lyase [Marasmius sp. AFHP31]|nr:mitochondrial 2-methylisocitrate lyase [Marasmius sp. AFHP31]